MELKTTPPKTEKCPLCGHREIWKKGWQNGYQRYQCKGCLKLFNSRFGTPFYGLMLEDGEAIMVTTIYGRYPLSSYQTAELAGLLGVPVDHQTILNYVQRFGPHTEKIRRKHRIKFSKVWHMDEKFLPHKRKPSKRFKRGEKVFAYQMTIEDSEGNVVASFTAPSRNTKAIQKLLKRAKIETEGEKPDIVVTDGHRPYKKALNVLGRKKDRHVVAHFEGKPTMHIDTETGRVEILKLSNNRIERYHSDLNPKVKKLRGVKNLLKADVLFGLYNFFLNYFRFGRIGSILASLGYRLDFCGLVGLFYSVR